VSRRILVALVVSLLAGPAAAQWDEGGAVDRYDAMYGKPVDVTLGDIILNPEMYESRAVRTRGRLERAFGDRDTYILRDMNAAAMLFPAQGLGVNFDSDARTWLGQVIEIT
jgi:predicted NBD/HSP70 family sugar kinase